MTTAALLVEGFGLPFFKADAAFSAFEVDEVSAVFLAATFKTALASAFTGAFTGAFPVLLAATVAGFLSGALGLAAGLTTLGLAFCTGLATILNFPAGFDGAFLLATVCFFAGALGLTAFANALTAVLTLATSFTAVFATVLFFLAGAFIDLSSAIWPLGEPRADFGPL